MERLVEEVSQIKDTRRQWGNLRHKLVDIIIIGLCTVITRGEDFDDMEEFGLEREQWLRVFLELPNGIPDGDTFRRVFERLDSVELSQCLYNWLEANRREEWRTVNIDVKTIRGSANTELPRKSESVARYSRRKTCSILPSSSKILKVLIIIIY